MQNQLNSVFTKFNVIFAIDFCFDRRKRIANCQFVILSNLTTIPLFSGINKETASFSLEIPGKF